MLPPPASPIFTPATMPSDQPPFHPPIFEHRKWGRGLSDMYRRFILDFEFSPT